MTNLWKIIIIRAYLKTIFLLSPFYIFFCLSLLILLYGCINELLPGAACARAPSHIKTINISKGSRAIIFTAWCIFFLCRMNVRLCARDHNEYLRDAHVHIDVARRRRRRPRPPQQTFSLRRRIFSIFFIFRFEAHSARVYYIYIFFYIEKNIRA